ncbi:MAG: long-chain fatty acid--CoA ligase [Rhodothermales bacterium]|nr:long-chain fatty acid--CoA ligase [Rhodothermales bacterium]
MPALVPFETIPELFTGLVGRFRGSNKPALAYRDRQTKAWTDISWEALHEQVMALAGYLHSQGVRTGDRVAVLAENRPEWVVTDLATQMLGAINVALYTTLPASQVAYILRDSGAKVFVVSTGIQLRKAEKVYADCPDLERVVAMAELRKDHPDYVQTWDEAMEAGRAYYAQHQGAIDGLHEAVGADDLCALIYTSGTTGNPKGVMLTHENFCSNAKAALDVIHIGPEDEHLSFLPLCHAFERTAGYTAALAGGCKITYAESIDTVSRDLTEVAPTIMISVPRLFERVYNLIVKSVEEGGPTKQRIFNWAVETGKKVAQKEADGKQPGLVLKTQYALAAKLVFGKLHEKLGGNLRFAVSGGAALPKPIGEFFQAAGIKIIEGYGLTETAPVLAANPYDAPRYGTVGHVLPGVTVGIQSLETGELLGQLRGEDYPSRLTTEAGEIVAKGPNIMRGYWNNEEATREVIDADGWFHTGDVGRFEEGYLRITDRIKHMIVSKGGKNVYPGPIEDAFKTNPLIDQVMVVGEGREYLTALVVPNYETLESMAREKGWVYDTPEALLQHEDVRQLYDDAFRAYSRGAASHERIRGFQFVPEAFTVENGLMTPTMKLRRRQIEEQHADLVDELYAAVV